MASIRKQLDLDYMRSSEVAEKASDTQAPPFLDDALISYGRPILEALR